MKSDDVIFIMLWLFEGTHIACMSPWTFSSGSEWSAQLSASGGNTKLSPLAQNDFSTSLNC